MYALLTQTTMYNDKMVEDALRQEKEHAQGALPADGKSGWAGGWVSHPAASNKNPSHHHDDWD